MTATWRFALRLARREVQRRAGRTLLVMLLIAVPVCGTTVVTVLVRSNTDSAAKEFTRQYGAADLVGSSDSRAAGPTDNSAPPFPAGTRVVHVLDTQGFVGLVTPNGTARLAEITDADLNDPITKGAVLLRSGRFPTSAGEALISPKIAKAFGVKIGDTLRLSTPAWTEKIVGIGVRATSWTDGFLDVRGTELTTASLAGGYSAASLTLVDLPGRPTNAELLQYPSYFSRADAGRPNTARAVNWIIVAGAVALVIVGIVISGAFAVGARRQLVTLGQLSANGADERLLRRTLSLQGLVSGALGSALGFGGGVAVLLLMHGHFANWLHHDPGPYNWSVRDAVLIFATGVVTATVAAFIPARSAARLPVLTALAGRRPLGALPKRLVPIGIGLFAGGVFVLALVASASGNRGGNGLAFSAMLGGLLVLSGACCASPVVIAGIGSAAGAVRGAARVAVRSVVRRRARSAAVVMALAAVNAGAIAIGTTIDSHTSAKFHDAAFMPDDTLIVSNGGPSPFEPAATPQPYKAIPASIAGPLHRILPESTWTTRRVVLGTPQSGGAPPVSVRGPGAGGKIRIRAVGVVPQFAMVTDPAVLQMLGLSTRDAAALQSAGAIDVQTQRDPSTKNAVTVEVVVGNPAHTIVAAVNRDSVRATGDGDGVFITAAKAAALHLAIVNAGVIIHNPQPLDESQRASVDALWLSLLQGQNAPATTNIAWSGTGGGGISRAAVRQIVLGIAVAIALIVLAMSLALSAAETRDERDVLVSLGARPSTMRSVSAWKATLLSASGAIVAVPTGFIPVAVVYLAIANSDQAAHITFPWSTVLQLVIVAPILAGLIAYVGSSIAQAVRPTRMSTFAND